MRDKGVTHAYADGLAADAAHVVVMVRDVDPAEVGRHLASLTRDRLEHLTIALAAMVPDDKSVAQLLAWCDPDLGKRQADARRKEAARRAQVRRDSKLVVVLAPHGTHAAFNRHRKNGETPCDLCVLGERTYQRERKRRERAAS